MDRSTPYKDRLTPYKDVYNSANDPSSEIDSLCFFTQATPEPGRVLYEENVQCFDDSSRKWKDRYIVIRANYVLECYESYKV